MKRSEMIARIIVPGYWADLDAMKADGIDVARTKRERYCNESLVTAQEILTALGLLDSEIEPPRLVTIWEAPFCGGEPIGSYSVEDAVARIGEFTIGPRYLTEKLDDDGALDTACYHAEWSK